MALFLANGPRRLRWPWSRVFSFSLAGNETMPMEAIRIADTCERELGLSAAVRYCAHIASVRGPLADEYAAALRVLSGRLQERDARGDSATLDAIAAELSSTEWNADTAASVAALVRRTGRAIAEPN